MKIIKLVFTRILDYFLLVIATLKARISQFNYAASRDFWILLEILHPLKLYTSYKIVKEKENGTPRKCESKMENNAEPNRPASEPSPALRTSDNE